MQGEILQSKINIASIQNLTLQDIQRPLTLQELQSSYILQGTKSLYKDHNRRLKSHLHQHNNNTTTQQSKQTTLQHNDLQTTTPFKQSLQTNSSTTLSKCSSSLSPLLSSPLPLPSRLPTASLPPTSRALLTSTTSPLPGPRPRKMMDAAGSVSNSRRHP